MNLKAASKTAIPSIECESKRDRIIFRLEVAAMLMAIVALAVCAVMLTAR